MKVTTRFMCGLSLAVSLIGCGPQPSTHKAGDAVVSAPVKWRPRVVFETPKGPVEVGVKIAKTPEETKRGLMYVDKLEEGRGMLFLMPEQRIQTFWMKNTYISLDMIFIDEAMKVAGIVEETEPLTLDPRFVSAPSRFVLEVPGGWSRKAGVVAGQSVRFLDVSR